jgi:hypothetical protein
MLMCLNNSGAVSVYRCRRWLVVIVASYTYTLQDIDIKPVFINTFRACMDNMPFLVKYGQQPTKILDNFDLITVLTIHPPIRTLARL